MATTDPAPVVSTPPAPAAPAADAPAVPIPSPAPALGSTPAPSPTDPAPAPAAAPVAPAGPPAAYVLTLPEGGPFGDGDRAQFEAEAKLLELTQDQAQRLVDQRAAMVATATATLLDDLKADPELGGVNFDATDTAAKKGRDMMFPPGTPGAELLGRLLTTTGLANHKELVRGFARIGRLMAEDRGPGSVRRSGPSNETLAKRLYPNAADG